jgi:hypothetical protein
MLRNTLGTWGDMLGTHWELDGNNKKNPTPPPSLNLTWKLQKEK